MIISINEVACDYLKYHIGNQNLRILKTCECFGDRMGDRWWVVFDSSPRLHPREFSPADLWYPILLRDRFIPTDPMPFFPLGKFYIPNLTLLDLHWQSDADQINQYILETLRLNASAPPTSGLRPESVAMLERYRQGLHWASQWALSATGPTVFANWVRTHHSDNPVERATLLFRHFGNWCDELAGPASWGPQFSKCGMPMFPLTDSLGEMCRLSPTVSYPVGIQAGVIANQCAPALLPTPTRVRALDEAPTESHQVDQPGPSSAWCLLVTLLGETLINLPFRTATLDLFFGPTPRMTMVVHDDPAIHLHPSHLPFATGPDDRRIVPFTLNVQAALGACLETDLHCPVSRLLIRCRDDETVELTIFDHRGSVLTVGNLELSGLIPSMG